MPEPTIPNPEAGHDHPSESADLARELQESAAETQRTATRQLADALQTSLKERQAVLARALGPEAYAEAMNYFRANADVNQAFESEPEAELTQFTERPPEFPAEEKTGAPESLRNFNDVEGWVDQEIAAAVEPYEVTRGQFFSQPKRFQDQGQEQVTISRYIPDTDTGVILEVTANGAPQNYRQLRKSLFDKEVVAEGRQLTPAESVDLEKVLNNYHSTMAEIAGLTPEEILEHAHHIGGPEAEPV